MTGTQPRAEAGPGLGREAARGGFVTIGGQMARMAVQLVSVAVLARLLTPQDYGLLAMVLVIVGVGEIFRDFGLSSAAVQARELSRAQRDNLFWINTAIGALLATAVALGAEAIAAVYDRPELADVARVLSLSFLINGVATQYRADLVRRLRFLQLAVADVASAVAALAVAAVLAATGAGYWALVAQTLVQAGALAVVLALAARWVPRLPRKAPMSDLMVFGWRLLGTQLVAYATNNTDALVIGLRFGAGPLGLYNRAFHLLMTPLAQLRAPTTTVALPVLSRLQDDPARYATFVLRGQLALGYSLVAGLALVAAAADPITQLFLGPRWTEVVPILRLLAVAGILQTLAYVGYWIYLSRGLTAQLFRYTLVTGAIRVTCILVGSQWGLLGVAVGYAVAPALAWPLSIWWLSRQTSIPTRGLYGGALRVLGCAAVAGLGAAAVDQALAAAPPVVRLLAAAATAVAAYAALTLVPPVRHDIRGVVEVVRLGLRRRSGTPQA